MCSVFPRLLGSQFSCLLDAMNFSSFLVVSTYDVLLVEGDDGIMWRMLITTDYVMVIQVSSSP